MADRNAPSKPVEVKQEDFATAGLVTLAEEYEKDKKTMRIAVAVAVVAHVVLLLITLPENPFSVPEAQKPKVYVVQQVRFQPPPPQQKQEIPKPKSKKVPIPDPTPDEPEPIRLEEPEPEIDLPAVDDIVFGLGPYPAVTAGPDPANAASIRVLEKNGFVHAGDIETSDGPEHLMRRPRND